MKAATPTGKAAVCARALAVQNSVGVLTAQDYTKVRNSQQNIAQVQKNLQSLQAVAPPEWKEQIAALSRAVSQLGKAIENLQGQATTAKAWQALGSAAEGVGKSTDNLRQSLSSTCPDLREGLAH
ncbi:hypothetical protein [Actinopolymorpha rutila]|uniref:Chromosome segregation ATPase n=1 Tax=Actinopolymorpha rutila TaxID=446787 RepID=A0A852Z6R4_9ACTN|nr:hypothetical protein [Actinopolymorpha rutila]NYH88654.1 chromosome segregation ATPase [Actinopolymorpha rutila]